jgi:lysophospholipase L1-like esterase
MLQQEVGYVTAAQSYLSQVQQWTGSSLAGQCLTNIAPDVSAATSLNWPCDSVAKTINYSLNCVNFVTHQYWPKPPATITVLPLGDSNTFGYGADDVAASEGYRKPLADLMAGEGITITYVGGLTDTRNPTFANNRHDGNVGYTISQLTTGASGYPHIPLASVSQFKPDVILLMIGTNDLGNGQARMISDYDALLGNIRQASPNSWIIVSTVFPVGWLASGETMASTYATSGFPWPINDTAIAFNQLLIDDINRRSNAGERISIVDSYAMFIPQFLGNYLVDDTKPDTDIMNHVTFHATAAGYANTATVWAQELQRVTHDVLNR